MGKEKGFILIDSIGSFINEDGYIYAAKKIEDGFAPDFEAGAFNMDDIELSCEVFSNLNSLDKVVLADFVSEEKVEAMKLNAMQGKH